MRKTSKTEQTNGASPTEAAAGLPPAPAEAPPKKRAPAAKKPAGKTAKKPAKAAAKKAAPRKTAGKKKTDEPSDVEIRLRAYFIAERRAQNFQQGDPAQDWIDARNELLAEAEMRRSGGKPPTSD